MSALPFCWSKYRLARASVTKNIPITIGAQTMPVDGNGIEFQSISWRRVIGECVAVAGYIPKCVVVIL